MNANSRHRLADITDAGFALLGASQATYMDMQDAQDKKPSRIS
jgi:hypothetical protein